jgi:hypothetical protein
MDKTYLIQFDIPAFLTVLSPAAAARAIVERFYQKLSDLRSRELLNGIEILSENANLLSFAASGPESRFRVLADYLIKSGEGHLTPNQTVLSSGSFRFRG